MEQGLNARQVRLRDFAVRKSCTWEVDGPSGSLTIRKLGDHDRTGRFLAVYRTGVTRTGARVAIVDPSAPLKRQLRWITYERAWSLLTENGL